MCETDYSGYPDCRDDTLKAVQLALSLGMDRRFTIETPLMWLDKAQTWQLANQLGGEPLVDLIRTATHTCYLGERATVRLRHVCGVCVAGGGLGGVAHRPAAAASLSGADSRRVSAV